jgi:hypothetical protein
MAESGSLLAFYVFVLFAAAYGVWAVLKAMKMRRQRRRNTLR